MSGWVTRRRGVKQRSRRVVLLFVRFFLELLYLNWLNRLRGPERLVDRRSRLYRSQARRFRSLAVDQGGLLIKIGQFLSTRVDILPREYTEELTGLQDEVASVPFSQLQPVIEEAFGRPLGEIYATFDQEPKAAASLGQVHEATLPSAERVAVKILRPGIERLVEADLLAAREIISLIQRFTRIGENIDLMAVYRELESTFRAELDYVKEGKNAERFAVNLAELDFLHLPKIHWEYTRPRVLTLEYIDGIKITNYHQLDEAGLDRGELARRLVRIYLKMVMEDGFFHADPHPGNIFALTDGRIALIDFGMVGEISPALRQGIRNLFLAVTHRSADEIIEAFVNLGFIRPRADLGPIRRAAAYMLDHFFESSLGDLYKLDLRGLGHDLTELVRNHPFQMPASVTLLGRALGTLHGVATGLDPNLNLVEIFLPFAKRMVEQDGDSFWGLLRGRVQAWGEALVEGPPLLYGLLQRVESGRLRFPLEDAALVRELGGIAAAIRRLTAVLTGLAIFIGGIYLEAHRGGGVGWTFAILGGLVALFRLRG